MAEGESLTAICRDDHTPSVYTVRRWLDTEEGFRTMYERAKALQLEYWADQIVEIADRRPRDRTEVEGHKLAIDSRKWVLCKLVPHKYGDVERRELSGPGGTPIQVEDRNSLIDSILSLVQAKADGQTKPDKGPERER